MLDTQNCLQNHIKNAKTIKCLYSQPSIQEALAKCYLSSCTAELGRLGGGCSPPPPPVFAKFIAKSPFFASNFGISMPTAPTFQSAPALSNSPHLLCSTTFGLSFM